MEINKLGNYSRLDLLKKRLLMKKVWFTINTFIFLPFSTWLFFVWLGPLLDINKDHVILSAWLQFWGVIIIISQIIFCWFILMKVNTLRDKIESIEFSMERK